MNSCNSKIALSLFIIGMSGSSLAALIDKDSFMETIRDSMHGSVCTENYNKCLGVTEKTCIKETNDLVDNKCSSDVPDEIEDLDELRSYAGSISECVANKYVTSHKKAMKANSGSAACKAVIK